MSLIFPPRSKSETGGTKTQQDGSTAQWVRTGIIHDLILRTAASLQLLTWSSGSKRQWLMLGNSKLEPCCHLYIRDKFRGMMWGQIFKCISKFLEGLSEFQWMSAVKIKAKWSSPHKPLRFLGTHSSIHNEWKKRNLLRLTQTGVAWNVFI